MITTAHSITGSTANPHRVRLLDQARSTRLPARPDLVARLATTPGLVRPGISSWDMKTRLPLHPLSVENAYGDPRLLHDLAIPGATFADRLGVDVIVGAETGGIPLAAAVALDADLPFAFVRKPGYVGHEDNEPRVRGAEVNGRRVLLVDDAVSQGTAIEGFVSRLRAEGATVVGAFVMVDMRDVATSVTPTAAALPTESIATYLQVLSAATDLGVLDPTVHQLAVDALVNHWPDDDPRWTLLDQRPIAA
ncbi:orotate phosphoribosyltransferase [Kribbella pittospori]|uniref:Orotate phosphoribosyltransferase n=1 Tax=Kribbella pittospori TaxID=722689 RepID=A0A4R0JTU3_9ACTN|nr:phosphoribosyltransferase family protein [Kribbella pittospori]TCC48548.1 orotate phosphoribosyltransferase [Kribbella pittospori]